MVGELGIESLALFASLAAGATRSAISTQRTIRHDVRSGLSPLLGFIQLAEYAESTERAHQHLASAVEALDVLDGRLDETIPIVVEAAVVANKRPFSCGEFVDAATSAGVQVEVDPKQRDKLCLCAPALLGLIAFINARATLGRVTLEGPDEGSVSLQVEAVVPDAAPTALGDGRDPDLVNERDRLVADLDALCGVLGLQFGARPDDLALVFQTF